MLAGLVAIATIGAASPAQAIEFGSGYDVSYPQCGATLPTDGAFEIVGVNGGLVFSENACLDEQLTWAGGTSAQLYINTGNLGPTSSYWPTGQTSPRVCSAEAPDTTGCAFNYGYNAAKDSYQRVQAAYTRLGLTKSPALTTWWLDVETSNSWRGSLWAESTPALTGTDATSRNTASVSGPVHFLQSVAKITKLGIYSTPYQWGQITGSSKAFSDLVSWHALGQTDSASALATCTGFSGFTGAPIVMTQYIDADLDLDVNVRCNPAVKVITDLRYTGRTTMRAGSYGYLIANLKTESGATMANRQVTFKFAGRSYVATTNELGTASVKVKMPTTKQKYSLNVSFFSNYYLNSDVAKSTLTIY
jgi:hypothetical protein